MVWLMSPAAALVTLYGSQSVDCASIPYPDRRSFAASSIRTYKDEINEGRPSSICCHTAVRRWLAGSCMIKDRATISEPV